MALDVWIGKPGMNTGDLAISFEPEAYYYFLYPVFEEFSKSSGKLIDPYCNVAFEPAQFPSVLELIDKSKVLVSAQPEEFEVYMGKNLGSAVDRKDEEIFHILKREKYLKFLECLRLVVLNAEELGEPLVFFGD
ncbi:MAG: hypothetical protein AAES65_03045 [Candidatus Thiodiazotropha sp. (ex. Lucinoma kazani)]